MQFELSKEIIDQIVFAMEDQDRDCLFDSESLMVVDVGEDLEDLADIVDVDDDRLLSLPDWVPADGFRLMERFTAALRNPPARQELKAALDQGRGVFRSYKDALKRYPAVETQWYQFKHEQMSRAVREWYNGLREEWGLARIGEEPEETEDLLLQDFVFRSPASEAELESALQECLPLMGCKTEKAVSSFIASFAAYTVSGDFAALAAANEHGAATAVIDVLAVLPEYQGLGLGERVLCGIIKVLQNRGLQTICLDIPSGVEGFSRVLARQGFTPSSIRYCLSQDSVSEAD